MFVVLSRWPGVRSSLPLVLSLLLVVIALLRVFGTYPVLSQAADEPATLAAGMEWLDRGTYEVDPLHPPLARVASALGPFLSGLRFPRSTEPGNDNLSMPFKVGDQILNQRFSYWHNLTLARLGMIPFLLLGAAVVFLWARELGGDGAAFVSVLLFTTLPPMLAFSGFAYTDMPVGVLVAASAFVFRKWLARPSALVSVLCGIVVALAVLSKFTALLFVPACWLAITACFLWLGPKDSFPIRVAIRNLPWCAVAFAILIWGGYRFSLGPLRSVFARPEHDIQALHLPGAAQTILARAMNVPIPAPALIKGLSWNLQFNLEGRPSYLLGDIRRSGWWYFFLVVLAVKTPLSFLLLAMIGGVTTVLDSVRKRDWQVLAPVACALALLLSSMPVKVNYGVRHILCVYAFLSIAAGLGALKLWQNGNQPLRWSGRAFLIVLVAWLLVSTSRIHPDYVAYFNELVGQHPDNVLLWGCDYDCGQDIARLASLSRERHIAYLSLAVFGNNDFTRMGLPHFKSSLPIRLQADG